MLTEKYRSSIHSDLLQKALLRGTFLGGLGACLLLSGTFLPPSSLKNWGLLIFFLSIGLIAWGLIPYRRLKRLETEPHEILILDDKNFLLCWKRKPTFSVQFDRIEKAAFISSGEVYGIGIYLIDSSLRSIQLYDKEFDLIRFQKQSIKKYGCDLFLPYFSERAFHLIFPTE